MLFKSLQESLAEMAKKNDITGKRALAQALAWRMARDREEGLALKKDKAIQDNERHIDLRLALFSTTILFEGNRHRAVYIGYVLLDFVR